jgi:multidrug resistance protein, MATE family
VAGGMLRGLQDTRLPLVIGGIGYWVVGMPIGWMLAFHFGFAGRGIWLGLAIGLAFVGLALIWRWTVVTRRMAFSAALQ